MGANSKIMNNGCKQNRPISTVTFSSCPLKFIEHFLTVVQAMTVLRF